MKVNVLENGPIIIDNGDEKVAICRCGHSTNQPYCTGTHKDANYEAPGAVFENVEQDCCDQQRCGC